MDRVQVELRGHVDKEIVDVIDAVSIARNVTRMDIVEQVLRQWASDRMHEAMLVSRITRSNGCSTESGGTGPAIAIAQGNPGGKR